MEALISQPWGTLCGSFHMLTRRDTLYGSFDKPTMRDTLYGSFDNPTMRDTLYGNFDKPGGITVWALITHEGHIRWKL